MMNSFESMWRRKGSDKFTENPNFEPGKEVAETVADAKVLCVGAGGLGCDLLKCLALSGFKDITVIDMDTIDLSNLNRQFLFRKKDVGRPKAQVAAEFIEKRVKGVKVTWYNKMIQEFDLDFYDSFSIVIAGLDNIPARRWLNSTLYSLTRSKMDEDGNLTAMPTPLIDGGTEGFKGQCRFFMPPITSCFECSVPTLPKRPKFEMCTLAAVPRVPEHCIAYAREVLWSRLYSLKSATEYKMEMDATKAQMPNGVKLDKDDPEHMTWLYNMAKKRADEYKISGVTYNLTMQVVKNIIPAIASTNAVIAASCVNEAVKFVSQSSYQLFNYYMYMGLTGVYSRTFKFEKDPNCMVCAGATIKILASGDTTLSDFLAILKEDQRYQLKDPGLADEKGDTIWQNGKSMRKMWEGELVKPIKTLFESGTELTCQDPGVLTVPLQIQVTFE